jgi:hypothetical protein
VTLNDAKRDYSNFAIVFAVIDPLQNRPVENPHGISEIDPMLGEIGRVFGRVPIKRHRRIYLLY